MSKERGNSLAKALMRGGDFHLRADARQMFGNYVELAVNGGEAGTLRNVRRAASVVETPMYSEPKLWQVDLTFDKGRAGGTPLSPWFRGTSCTLLVTLRAALDRDKAVAIEQTTLVNVESLPASIVAGASQASYPTRFQAAHQLGVSVEILGAPDVIAGVQASVVEVATGERDAYGSAALSKFDQSSVSQVFLLPNALRRQFIVQNWGTTPLYVAFNSLAGHEGSGSGAQWTFALPNRGDVYESPRDCYQGYVSGIWTADAGASTDVAVVTEGT